MQPPPIPNNDAEHLRILVICHYVKAGLTFLMIGFLYLHYSMMKLVLDNPEIMKAQQGQGMPFDPQQFFALFKWFYLFGGVFMLMTSIVTLLSARFIQRRVNRMFSIIIGGGLCLFFPLGTALGVFTIIILGRDSVRRLYAEPNSAT